MTKHVDQIEKQTIVARLSVSIYKMGDEDLFKLMESLENDQASDISAEMNQSLLENEGDAKIRRQMTIARLFVLINNLDKDSLLQRLRSFRHASFQWVREYPRLQCHLIVDFESGGRVYQSYIRDISASGVFIESKDHFEVGQDVKLCFAFSESDEMLPFKIRGKITRVYSEGIGVRYEDMTSYQRDIIEALIKK